MGEAGFSVHLTGDALAGLTDIDTCWSELGEAWRGEKYHWDLRETAIRELSDATSARRGRHARGCDRPGGQETLAFATCCIIYEIDEAAERVNILRFWHAHRDAPPLE